MAAEGPITQRAKLQLMSVRPTAAARAAVASGATSCGRGASNMDGWHWWH